MSYEFTAVMEDVLDEIAAGRRDRNTELAGFYFGNGDVEGLKKLVSELGDIDARELATFRVAEGVDLRVGRYGPYVETPEGTRANVPDDLPPDELTPEKAKELLANPAGEETTLGEDPETGLRIVAKNGRYGPYLKKGTDSRSIEAEEKLLTITLEEAQAVYAQPKQRGRAAADPGREIGKDPVSGNTVTLKSGRFGSYVTDGEYNATLRQGDDEATLTIERAAELLEERRAKGPAKKTAKKGTKKSATKAAPKTATKKAPKAATKKAPAKKSATKKTTTKTTTSATRKTPAKKT